MKLPANPHTSSDDAEFRLAMHASYAGIARSHLNMASLIPDFLCGTKKVQLTLARHYAGRSRFWLSKYLQLKERENKNDHLDFKL